jgi:hypothetical protein
MSSKRGERRRACGEKRRYASEEAARVAMRAVRESGDWMGVYKCRFCQQWHVGHMPAKVRQALRDKRRFERKSE